MPLLASSAATRQAAAKVTNGCLPTASIAPNPRTIDGALDASRRLIPAAYRANVNPWAHYPRISQLMLLEPVTPALPA